MALKVAGQIMQQRKNNRLRRRFRKVNPNLLTSLKSKNIYDLRKRLEGGKKLLLEEQRQQIKKDLIPIKGSLAIEGLILTNDEESLVIANALGHISDEEFERRVMELINNE